MKQRSRLLSVGELCKVFILSVMLTLVLASAAFAQLVPTLSIDDVTLTEGDAGTTNATFTVTRSGDQTLVSTVNFATVDDTATQPGDYASTSGTLTFAAGETMKIVTVSVNGDTLDEADEKFFINLSTVVDATISDNQGVGTIIDDDDTPQVNDDGSATNPITLTEDDPNGMTTNVLANDTGLSDTPITVGVTNSPARGTAMVNADKTITYTPDENQNGPDTYSYTVTDSDNQTSTATVYLQITPVNDAPIVDSVTNDGPVSEGSSATIRVTATDPEGDVLSYKFDCDNDNTFEIGPQAGHTTDCSFADDGTRRVNMQVSDGNGGASTGFTNVTVNNVPPNAVDDSASADEGGPDVAIDVLDNDTDVSGDPLTIENSTPPPAGEGSVSCSASNCTFTPDADLNGTTSFGYTVIDGDGGTDTATVTVTINAVNDTPSFTKGENPTVNEDAGGQAVANWVTGISKGPANESGQSVSFDVTNDNNALFSVQPAVSSGGTLTYTSAANASGTANVEVVARDSGGTANGGDEASDPQTFTITVNPVNDAPTVSTMADKTIEKDTNTGFMAFAVGDVETSASDLTVTGSSSNTTLVPDANIVFGGSGVNRTVKVTPAASKIGMATITVRLSDGSAQATDTFFLTVRDTKAPTVTSVKPLDGATGTAVTANVYAFFSEAMRAGSVNANTVRLYQKGSAKALAASVSYDLATKKATLDPSTPLLRGKTYKVVVATGLRDLAGNSLDQNPKATGNQPKVWFFTVRS